MKVKHSKPRGQRILKTKKNFRPLWIEPEESGWWYKIEEDKWINCFSNEWDDESIYSTCSSYYAMKVHGLKDVWSLKAAKRKIKKWNVPSGTVFRVDLPWKGYGFKITK